MNLKFYLEKLKGSEEFKKFVEENAGAFLCSGFFILDKGSGEGNKYHLDYYVPSSKKMFSFQLKSGVDLIPVDANEHVPVELGDCDFVFEDVEKLIVEEMERKEVKKKMQKILLSLQNVEGRDVLVGTIFVSGLGLIKINIDVVDMKVTEFEKKSFFDIVKRG